MAKFTAAAAAALMPPHDCLQLMTHLLAEATGRLWNLAFETPKHLDL